MKRKTIGKMPSLVGPRTSRRCESSRVAHVAATAIALLAAAASLCRASVLTVTQDGAGDYATVWEALVAAEDGDEIWIESGYYDEGTDEGDVRALSLWGKSFALRGQGSGPDAVTIAYLRLYLSADVLVENLTFTHSCSPLYIDDWEDAIYTLDVRNCIFRQNGIGPCSANGAAILAYDYRTRAGTVLVDDCVFEENNTSDTVGGTIFSDADLTITNSTFVGNTCGGIQGFNMIVDGCLFWDNVGNAIIVYGEHDIRNSTFWGNRAQSAIYTISGPPAESKIRNCVIGRTIGGYGMECFGWVEVTCCLLSFNDLGNWGYCEPPPGSGVVYDVDPLFCDEEAGDFRVQPNSPCLAGEIDGRYCDLIGAYGVGCGATPTIETSWGSLKYTFR